MGKFIPFIYVFVEDELAKTIIGMVVRPDHGNGPKSAVKCIVSGAWMNQAACMYGFYTYGNELHDAYQFPFFSALAVNDGDVSQAELDKRLKAVIKGSLNNDQEAIRDKIRAHTTQFTLTYLHGPNGETIKGLPEYNHKHWFEEITEQMILDQHQDALARPDPLGHLRTQHEVNTLLEVIAYSRTLFNSNDVSIENHRIDYHAFYTLLKAFTPQRPDDVMNSIEYYVLRAIRRYNPARWDAYTAQVRERIMALAEENHERFLNSRFDLR
ncbi:hypothetical protein HZ99_01830 [Pseudomonas fluorescens]|nr:hypothetical protein HZ99_01830 [Pseudomonas fluorescens]